MKNASLLKFLQDNLEGLDGCVELRPGLHLSWDFPSHNYRETERSVIMFSTRDADNTVTIKAVWEGVG